jgi:hypothetical protein
MSPAEFTRRTTLAGLNRKSCGLEVVAELRQIIAKPQPVKPLADKWKSKSPAGKAIACLIRHGMACLNPDKQTYDATQAGRDWLQQLKAHNLVP